MKIFFFNDKNVNSVVYLMTMAHENIVIVPPQTSMIFEIPIKKDQIPFLKQWDNCTLISSCDEGGINGQVATVSRS